VGIPVVQASLNDNTPTLVSLLPVGGKPTACLRNITIFPFLFTADVSTEGVNQKITVLGIF
jgi:hypothetical protein